MKGNTATPGTVEELIKKLINELSLRDRSRIANMEESELGILHPTLGNYIRNKFLWSGNKTLMQDFRDKAGRNDIFEDVASMAIIHALWKRLKETHTLRVVN